MSESEDPKLIDELIAKAEGPTVDFKRAEILPDPVRPAKIMAAFANTIGGRIFIGVCDDRRPKGLKSKKEHQVHIMNICRDKCLPPLAPISSVMNKPQGDICVVKVEP